MKKAIAMVLLAVLVVCNAAGVTADEGNKVSVDEEIFSFGETRLITKNNRILVPLKCGIFERFSAVTEYDHIYQEVVIRTDTQVLTLYTDQLMIYDKGEECYELDVGAEYMNGEIYVPLRAFIESMGKMVEYDEKTHTAKLYL